MTFNPWDLHIISFWSSSARNEIFLRGLGPSLCMISFNFTVQLGFLLIISLDIIVNIFVFKFISFIRVQPLVVACASVTVMQQLLIIGA